MPELPEVQTVVNDLIQANVIGRKISGVKVFWRRTVCGASDRYLASHLLGRKIAKVRRRGKYIVFDFDDGTHALLHLRMSGRIFHVKEETPRCKHEHLVLNLSDVRDLRFHDTRKFGRFFVGKFCKGVLEQLGPEPLADDFTPDILYGILIKHDRSMKALLLDQRMMSGLGNIYTDEALWHAKIHPQEISSQIRLPRSQRLFKSIRKVLNLSLANFGTTLGEGLSNFRSVSNETGSNRLFLKVYGREGCRCVRCRAQIERIKVSQRSTYFCPRCQKLKTINFK